MSRNRFVFDGLAELKEALRTLPSKLLGEAGHIVEGAANGAAVDIRAGYGAHRFSGNLQDHVIVDSASTGFSAGAIVKSTARHAVMFEHGTQARHYITKNGVKHLTGRMPPGNVFIPAMQRRRRTMHTQLGELLERNGLEVSGDA